jgi:hypothetical protein
MRWVSLALLVVWTNAHAQPKPRSRADALFEQGRKHMEAGKFAEACAAFEESQQLDSAVTTLLNLGACREKLAQLASAVSVFRAAERSARREGTATSTQLADIAAGHIKRLEPRLSTLTIQVPRANRIEGLVITRNGVPVETTLWDVPAPLDGGAYKIVAKAPGREPWNADVKLAPERETKAIRIPPLAPSTVPTVPIKDDEVEEQPAGGDDRGGRSLVWPIVFGVGALGAGAGAIVFYRRGEDTYAKAKVEPDPMRQDNLWQDANRQSYIAQGLAVAGVGLAAVSIYLLVRGGGSSNRQVALQPIVDANGNGLFVNLGGSY